MKLSEKIIYYRKRAGLSQEALADKLNVSRQAVSKWETGEAVPELNKVVLLSKVFQVTTDELLLDETEEEAPDPAPASAAVQSNWVESIPGVLGRLLRRYGWLSGVYIAVCGALFTAMGALAKSMVNSMTRGFGNVASSFYGDTELLDSVLGGMSGSQVYINGELVNTASSFAASNPVSTMGSFIMGLGIIMMIGGAALAVILRKKSRE